LFRDRLLDVRINLAGDGVQVFTEQRTAFSLGVLLAEHDVFASMAIADSPDAYHILIRVVSHTFKTIVTGWAGDERRSNGYGATADGSDNAIPQFWCHSH
jgi:hypothetical protein